MIDPRQSPVAMLPHLNAVAGHLIAQAAPLRVINVEDTEQMITEACIDYEFDCDVMEAEVAKCFGTLSFFKDGEAVALSYWSMNFSDDCARFLDVLKALIEENV